MMGEGTYYREQHNGRVQCRKCGEEIEAGSLEGHRMKQYGQAAEEIRSWETSATGEEPRTYCMAFLAMGGLRS